MYIKSLGMVFIQGFKEALIEFHPGFNVICGDSDSGKSTILRTISWIAKDQPNGNVLENWDMNKKDVMAGEMILCDQETGHEISILKERKGSTSSYTLSNHPGTFDVVKRNVPEEVSEIINFSDLNFKGQHDPYLLKVSGGQLAKMINDLVGISVIDKSKKYENSKITRLEGSCKDLESNIKTKENEISALSYLDKLDADISEIEVLESRKLEITSKISSIQKICQEIVTLKSELEENKEILKISKEAESINVLIIRKSNIETEINRINALSTTIKETKSSIEYERAWLEAQSPYQEIVDLQSLFSSIKNKKEDIEILIASIKSFKEKVKQAQEKKVSSAKQYKEFLNKNNTCPTCLRKLDEKTINSMVNS